VSGAGGQGAIPPAGDRGNAVAAGTWSPRAVEPIHGWLVARFDAIDSTNDEARRRLDAAQSGARGVVAATEQRAGRGTRGRTWSSPAGAGLYCSRWERTPPPAGADGAPAPTEIVFAAAVAAAEAIERATAAAGLEVAAWRRIVPGGDDRAAAWVGVEPINDLVVPIDADPATGLGKLGGILVETVLRAGRVDGLVVGVGLNTRAAARTVRADGRPAISLAEALGAAPPPGFEERILLPHLVERLDHWIGTLRRAGPAAVVPRFEARRLDGGAG